MSTLSQTSVVPSAVLLVVLVVLGGIARPVEDLRRQRSHKILTGCDTDSRGVRYS